MTQCSYGKWDFRPADNVVVPFVVNVPCSGTGSLGAWSASTCRDVDRGGWAEWAHNYIKQVRLERRACMGGRGQRRVEHMPVVWQRADPGHRGHFWALATAALGMLADCKAGGALSRDACCPPARAELQY